MKTKLTLLVVTTLLCTISQTSFAQANVNLSNLSSPTAVNQHLLPGVTGKLNLGSPGLAWNNVYFNGALYTDSVRVFRSNKALFNLYAGANAGFSNSIGNGNTGIGHQALYTNLKGNLNTASGYNALYSNKNGASNIGIGAFALYKNINQVENVAVGNYGLYNNTDGYGNVAMGEIALYANTTGYNNTAIGTRALPANISGFANVAIGHFSLNSNSTGSNNVAVGDWSLWVSHGYGNTAVGKYSLYNLNTGNNNTSIGDSADVTFNNLNNATAIGFFARVDASNKVRVGNTAVTSIGGQVGWSIFSDGRYKKDIKEDVKGLSFINSLRPITYTVDTKSLRGYFSQSDSKTGTGNSGGVNAEMTKSEDAASKIIYSGFIAQEVEAAASKLNFDFSGVDKPQTKDGLYGLRYDNFVVPLVKAVQELSKLSDDKDSKIVTLQKEMDAKDARLDDLQNQLNALKAIVQGTASANASPMNNITLSAAKLEQNAPNPFSNGTTIQYTLPQKFSSAQIIFTDKTGQLIKQVTISGTGKGSINFDASTLASGTYSYSLVLDGKIVATKQMMMLAQ